MSTFPASTKYESWISRLRLSLATGPLMRGFAQIIGDRVIDWATQANLEHQPQYASSAASVALIASERQIDAGPAETTKALAARLSQAVPAWRLAGRPLGLLLALHYAGFDDVVVVQQNGNAYQLTLPLAADVTTNLVVTQLGLNYAIGGGVPWWTFDSNNAFCSRFMILFTRGVHSWINSASAVFDGTQDYKDITWPNPLADASYHVLDALYVTDGGGPVAYLLTNKTTTGMRVMAPRFSGQVDLLAYTGNTNPWVQPTASNLAQLRRLIAKWKPAKSTCVGFAAITQGRVWGWPKRTWGDGSKWGLNTVDFFAP